MKQHTRRNAFIGGMLSAVLLLGCGTAAFAAGGGSMSIGSLGLMVNGKTVIKAGDQVTNPTGQKIPAAITYTDAAGGGNTYLPIRTISELLDIPVSWENNTIYLGEKPGSTSPAITFLNPSDPGDPDYRNQPGDSSITAKTQVGSQAGPYTEVEPFWPDADNDSQLIRSAHDEYTSQVGGIGNTYNPVFYEGQCFSISIKNETEYPLVLYIASLSTMTREKFPSTVVPAGETVIRTFRAGPHGSAVGYPGITYSLRFFDEYTSLHNAVCATVNVVSFDP